MFKKFVTVFIIVLLIFMYMALDLIQDLQENIDTLDSKINSFETKLNNLYNTTNELSTKFSIDEFIITGYAPHDKNAVTGICHDGNPNVTASGTYPTPGRTIAVDPKIIPFGSKVYIEGVGYRIAEDTGGLIKGNKIDLCFASKSEALNWGKKRLKVIHFK